MPLESGTAIGLQTPLVDLWIGPEQYAPALDRKRFLIAVPAAGSAPSRFAALVNWQQPLRQEPR